ncbi:MAG: prenyltransferase/squalene oxidase repeat-containing protein, partial [Solirubrobacterales bacterium]
VSNFWFGQGPWTPWQLAGWGLCGVLGAALALGGRTANRFVLAAVCGFAGVAYGALLNFSLMATYGGELSLQRFGLLEGRAIPFDAAHAAANVAFALVAGPAMLRMLVRFRQRFEWSRRGGSPAGGAGDGPPPGGGAGEGNGEGNGDAPPGRRRLVPGMRGGAAAASIVLLALAVLVPAPADAAQKDAIKWLESTQNSDGGWGDSPGDDSGTATTDWTMLGLEAAGVNPLDVTNGGNSPADYLRSRVGSLRSPGSLARTILALSGAGLDPRHFAGRNLVAELSDKRRDNGSFEGWPGSTAFAIIALRAAGAPGAAEPAAAWLRKAQNADGGWGDTPGSPSTSDGTGAAMMALAGSKAAQRGLNFLRNGQRTNGGFPLGEGFAVNTQSTAWAVQGIIAAGGNPYSFKPAGNTPFDYLALNQEPDGHYRYAIPGNGTSSLVANQSPVWTTAQALGAVAKAPFPIADVPAAKPPPRPQKSSPTPTAPVTPPLGADSESGLPPSAIPQSALPELPTESGVTAPGAAGGKPSAGGDKKSGGAALAPGQAVPAAPGESGAEADEATGLTPQADTHSAARGASRGAEPASADDSGGSSGVAVSIHSGLLAGCLIFGLAWAARRGWMRWRYGL